MIHGSLQQYKRIKDFFLIPKGRVFLCDYYLAKTVAVGRLSNVMEKKIIPPALGSRPPITAADVEVCHRVPVAREPSGKNINVQCTHRAKRNIILEKARRPRLIATDLGFQT